MGLSSKQVSINGLDWDQTLLHPRPLEQQQQQSTPLKCPRCDSTNTKFCYYNNYNKSQPRHLCKSCKRHWTNGGSLRNVPVGGGRKNKRIKTSNSNSNSNTNTNIIIQPQKQQNLPLDQNQKPNSEILYQALLHQPPSTLPLSLQPDCIKNSFINSNLPLPSIPNLPFTSLISFEGDPASISASFQPSNLYNYTQETKNVENPSLISTTTTVTPPWQISSSSNFMDSTRYWSWDDLTRFVSTDLKQPWDDSQNKPQ